VAKEKTSAAHKALTVVGIVLCAILIPILIINLTLIGKSIFHKDEVPSIGGTMPLIVLTDSMYPIIESGDLIICHKEEPENIKVGDVISFFDPAGNGSTIVTHRVEEITQKDGQLAWRTKGDNNTGDRLPVTADKLVAVYKGTRLAGIGNVALFMQTTPGLILCVVLPILLLVGYDVIRRRLYEKANKQDTDRLLAELEELRRLKAEKDDRSGKDELP